MSEELELYEALSRLLDGHVDAHAAAQLRQRIATEPAVARAWAELQATAAALNDLPDPPPPPELDQRVLRSERRQRSTSGRRPSSSVLGAFAMAAAVTLALLAWPEESRQLVLVEGEQWVDGQALVLAGGVPVKVDGLARISVEPSPGAVRESAQEVESMDWKHVAAAAAGALVTVAVYEGTAQVGDGEHPVAQGEQWSSDAKERPAPQRELRRQLAGPALEEGQEDPASLRARIAELEDQLAMKDLEGAIQRGRIAAVEGHVQEWPKGLPEVMQPAAFEAWLRDEVAASDDLDLLEVNCDEYPCYAIIEGDPGSVGPGEGASLLQGLAENSGEPLGIFNMASVTGGPGGDLGLQGVALVPADRPDDSLTIRLNYRVESSMKGWSEDFMAEQEEVEIGP